jgi:hypothetical protein
MGLPIPSAAISDATTGGLSVIVVTGGADGDVLTRQSDGTYLPVAPTEYQPIGDYATAAQGSLADSAVQPGDLATVATTGSYNDLSDKPAAASGDVVGPASAVDNAAARFDTTTGKLIQSSNWIIADNLTASPNNTVNHACLEATGGTTNVSVSIKPKGTGSFTLAVPDGSATGGNGRGANAVDLQTFRTVAGQVASGMQSVICGGAGNTASGEQSGVTHGQLNVASGQLSDAAGSSCTASALLASARGSVCTASAQSAVARGERSLANRLGMYAAASGQFSAVGDAQYVRFVARRKTTDNTATTLFLDGSTTRLTITSGKILFADILVSGVKSDGSAAACYKRKVAIKNVGGTTTLVGSVETIGTDIEDNASTDIAITADNTNDALQINVTGITAETWRWVAVVEGLEIAYGT